MESRFLSIQYLRGFAALVVVVYHAMRWVHPSFEIGAAGVDIFFVISGFILWTVANIRPVTPKTFLARRWARVVPLYWLMTLIVAAIVYVRPDLIWDANLTWPHLLLSLAFIPHLNAEGAPFPLITAGWSMNYEAVFYLLFAISLLAPPRRRLLALTIGVLCIPVIGLTVRGTWFLGFNLMVLQFLSGAGLAQWRLKRGLPSRKAGAGMVLAGLGLFAVMAPMNLFEAIYRAIWWGIPSFLLVAGLVTMEDKGGLPDVPVMRILGDASYSIYLSHVVVVQVLSHFIRAASWPFVPIAIAASLAAGLATHYLLERPLIGAFKRKPAAVLPSRAV